MKKEETLLAYQCANLYYVHNRSQEEVAKELNISRPKVSRLLALAQRVGIVTISVRPPELFDGANLESELVRIYKLKNAYVAIPEDSCETAVRRSISFCFKERVIEGILAGVQKGIGIGVGSTIYETVKTLQPVDRSNSGFTVVPLIGTAGQSDPAYQSNNIVDLLSGALNSDRKYLMAPMYCENLEQKAAFLASPQVSIVVKQWDNLDTAIFGLGKAIEESAVLYSSIDEKLLVQLVQRHAVGDIVSRFFDQTGSIVNQDSEDLIIGIPFEKFKKIPERICLSGGPRKVAGIRAALSSGYVTTLVTDLFTAQELIQTT